LKESIFAPRVTPRQINPVQDIAVAPDIGPADGVPGGTGTGGVPGGWSEAAPAPAPPSPPAVRKAAPGPVRVGGVVIESNLIHRVQPLYPPLARSSRVQGTVEFTAVISKQGTIENLRIFLAASRLPRPGKNWKSG